MCFYRRDIKTCVSGHGDVDDLLPVRESLTVDANCFSDDHANL